MADKGRVGEESTLRICHRGWVSAPNHDLKENSGPRALGLKLTNSTGVPPQTAACEVSKAPCRAKSSLGSDLGKRKGRKMNRFKVVAIVFLWGLVAVGLSVTAKADDWNKETTLTFDQPVEIPGHIVLPAGTYVFKLMDSPADRHIVQIFSKDRTHLYATILAIPNYRLRTSDRTVMTFGERAVGLPEAIRAWFYPGDNWGQEFVYPKARAVELAKMADLPVLATSKEFEFTKPEVKDELKQAPIVAIRPTGEEVEVAQVVEPPPAEIAAKTSAVLPKTASQQPLVALIGFLTLGAGLALWGFSKRRA